jgi:predicted 3-demethylubiquinone-9 3-methyltransferase (glyoxalase superfamily)
MQSIKPFLWYDSQAQEAANFYMSIFRNSRITDSGPMSVSFELDGREFVAFNGGPHFKFTPATSLFVTCDTQAEVDEFWEKLSEGGEKGRCGWVTDKFGLSWQVIPRALMELMGDDDEEKSERVRQAMLAMHKIDIAELQKAYRG